MIYKKSIIMSSVSGGKEKAVINFDYKDGELGGTIRLYNFREEPEGILSLGILLDNKVLKAGLVKKSEMQYNFVLDHIKELDNVTCALVNLNQGKVLPLLKGSTNGTNLTEEKLANALNVFDTEPTIDNVTKVLDDNDIEFEEQSQIEKEIEQCLENCENTEKCTTCKYRDAFYKLEEEPDKTETEGNTPKSFFFDSIKEQIEELFNGYPEEEFLRDIIPNSKWAKIDYENKGEYYVVGLLYEEGNIKYVCYGVPGMYSVEPPKELSGFSQWLPLDSTKKEGFGYWLTYQDAETGESVKIDYNVI